MSDLKSLIEAYLFVSDTPLNLDRLCSLTETSRDSVKSVIEEIKLDYQSRSSAVDLVAVAGGYQFRTRPELAPWLRRLQKDRPIKMSPAALETLAIIAYRQPVTRAEVEYLRGVDSGAVIKTLLERNLLRLLGKKETPGRPLLYGTSRYFLEFLGMNDLNELPTLKEFAALEPEMIEAVPLEPAGR